jgi:ribonuclease HI
MNRAELIAHAEALKALLRRVADTSLHSQSDLMKEVNAILGSTQETAVKQS